MVLLISTDVEEKKICTKCRKSLPRGQFYKKGKFWDSRCKSCISVGKKDIYLSKKAFEDDSFKDVFIMPFSTKMDDADVSDLVDVLSAFLMEEFDGAKKIRASE